MSNLRYDNLKIFVMAAVTALILGGCLSSSKREMSSNCPRAVAVDRTDEGSEEIEPEEELGPRQDFAADQASYNEQLSREAIQEWSKAIEAHPRCAENYRERGWQYSNAGKFDSALKDLTRAIAIDAKSSDSFCKRAWVRISLEEYEAAVRDCTKAIALDRFNSSAYEARADAYSSLGKDALAARDRERLHQI